MLEVLNARWREVDSPPDGQTLVALYRTLAGVGDARRSLNAVQGYEAALIGLIQRLTGNDAIAGIANTSTRGFALPLILGPSHEEPSIDVPSLSEPEHELRQARIRVRLLGRFDVEIDGVALPAWRSRRARQLFQYLLLNHGEEVSRHRLMGLFWPDHSEGRAENNLSLTVMTLRRVLEQAATGMAAHVVFRSGAYFFEHDDLGLDIDAFDAAIEIARDFDKAGDAARAAEAFDTAIALYGGELLPGEIYEEWTVSRRRRLEDCFLEALQRRATLGRLAGDFELSVRLNQRAIEVDPALEAAHRQLILDYLATGQRSRAVQQIDACRDALRRHLGEEPDNESQAVFARVAARINRQSIADQG